MLMTETVPTLTTSPLDNSASTMVGDDKKSKRVGFAENVATVVAHIDLGKPAELWYSKLDLKVFKEKAKALSEHLHQSQPLLTLEIEDAYSYTRARKEVDGADQQLFTKWHKLSSGRRGLERFVLAKQKRQEQAKEVKASRSVVLNLQCLLQRSPNAAQLNEQHAEMIRQQYCEFAKPAMALAQIYARKDAEAVKPYYQDEDDSEDEDVEEILLDDGVLSVGSSSVSSFGSRNSMSAKKVKKRSDGSDSSESSSSKGSKDTKKKSSSKKKKSSSSKIHRSKSPMRRVQSVDCQLEDCRNVFRHS